MAEITNNSEQNPHTKIIQQIEIDLDRIQFRKRKSDHDPKVIADLRALEKKCRENNISSSDANTAFQKLHQKIDTLLKIEDKQNELDEWKTKSPSQPDEAQKNPSVQINWSMDHEAWEVKLRALEAEISSLKKSLKQWWERLF